MDTTTTILTVIAIIVVLAIIGLVTLSMRRRTHRDNAVRATQLREQADARAAAEIPDALARATTTEAEAERARREAQRAEERAGEAKQDLTQQQAAHEDQIRAADRLDPAVDTKAADYSPHTILDDTTTSSPETVTSRPADDAQGPTEAGEPGSHRA